MAGHVFVVRADIRKLACDAWLLPCSRTARPSGPWFLDDHQGPRGGEPLAEDGPRTQPLPGIPGGRPRPWLTRVGGSNRPVRWYVQGAVEFLEAAARDLTAAGTSPLFRRELHLLALPVVGTGRGGAAGRAGEVVQCLLPELEAFTGRAINGREFDVALVCWDAPSYAAAQAERVGRNFWPAFLTRALRAEAEVLAGHALAGRLALFLGAGVSAAAGLPTWADLLDRLAARAG